MEDHGKDSSNNLLNSQNQAETTNTSETAASNVDFANHERLETVRDPPNSDPATESTDTVLEKREFLMKRTRFFVRWVKNFLILKGDTLFYSDVESNTTEGMKAIALKEAEILESDIDKKEHAFSIKPKDDSRFYYFQALNKEQYDSWLQALCLAKMSGRQDGNSEACSIQ